MKASDPEAAVEEFLGLPALEKEKGDWGFKGLKQAIKLEFKLGLYDKVIVGLPTKLSCSDSLQAVEHYTELLTYVKSAVTRNYSEKSINNILDYIEKGAEDEKAGHCMEEFYSQTLQSFQSTNNERLWLKTNIKLAKLFLDRKEYGAITKKLRSCTRLASAKMAPMTRARARIRWRFTHWRFKCTQRRRTTSSSSDSMSAH